MGTQTNIKGLLVGVSKPVITGAAKTKDLLTYFFAKHVYVGGVI